jgi:hypothetical protein
MRSRVKKTLCYSLKSIVISFVKLARDNKGPYKTLNELYITQSLSYKSQY